MPLCRMILSGFWYFLLLLKLVLVLFVQICVFLRNLYWTDTEYGEINVATDDGRYKKTLIQAKRFQPAAIVVNPRTGWVRSHLRNAAQLTGSNGLVATNARTDSCECPPFQMVFLNSKIILSGIITCHTVSTQAMPFGSPLSYYGKTAIYIIYIYCVFIFWDDKINSGQLIK